MLLESITSALVNHHIFFYTSFLYLNHLTHTTVDVDASADIPLTSKRQALSATIAMGLTQSAPACQVKTRLLSLPPELRNRVYGYVACSAGDTVLHGSHITEPELPLARTCRQVKVEFMSVYKTYLREEAERISFDVNCFEFDDMMRFIQTLRLLPQPKMLRRQLDIFIIHPQSTKEDFRNLER